MAYEDDTLYINRSLNISDFMYYGQGTSYGSTGLQSDINLTPLLVRGQPLQIINNSQGLYAAAFISTVGPKQIFIGYEGTNLYTYSNAFTAGQVQADAAIIAGAPASSYKTSASFASEVVSIAKRMGINKNNVFVTGHSLGAAEAEYAAKSVGLNGMTFGTPGIPLSSVKSAARPRNVLKAHLKDFFGKASVASTPTVKDYVDYGDPVGNYAADGPNVYGNLLLNPDIKHYNSPQYVGATDNSDYLTDAIEDYNDGYYDSAAYRFSETLAYHKLSNYATDLQAINPNVQLYSINGQSDPSGGAASAFIAPLLSTRNFAALNAACFASGTRIRTLHSEEAIQDLQVGDHAMTSSGAFCPIRWLGHRTIDCSRDTVASCPIRIAAHAFGENRPSRDLFVSPGHAICVVALDEVLIPAGLLVNGSTIRQVEVDEVTYWHVELDSHDIILAENLPAESYLDMGNRDFFAEGAVVALTASPDADPSERTHADFCRPFVDGGPVLEAVRLLLRNRAKAIGWMETDALDMHLVVDGQRLDPVVRGLTARFHLPAEAKDVWLVSPTARPRDTLGGTDTRDLGLYIGGLRIDDGFATRDVAIDDPLLCIGFHAVEDGSRRWTAGRARLPAALWEGCEGGFYLRIDLAGRPVPRWVAPAAEAERIQLPRLAIVA